MDIILKRNYKREDGIFGELFWKDGELTAPFGYSLEHSYPPAFTPKIPVGTYKCVRGIHWLNSGVPVETFEVKDVPGHTGILFHTGNSNADSSGCILVGRLFFKGKPWRVIESRLCFQDFMKLQEKVNAFELTVGDDYEVGHE